LRLAVRPSVRNPPERRPFRLPNTIGFLQTLALGISLWRPHAARIVWTPAFAFPLTFQLQLRLALPLPVPIPDPHAISIPVAIAAWPTLAVVPPIIPAVFVIPIIGPAIAGIDSPAMPLVQVDVTWEVVGSPPNIAIVVVVMSRIDVIIYIHVRIVIILIERIYVPVFSIWIPVCRLHTAADTGAKHRDGASG
jgi:hypothetical protein